MRAVVGFIDSRDNSYAVVVHGMLLTFDTLPPLALAVHSYGFHFVVEPPEDEGWPDYIETDGRFYMAANEELHQLREEIRERHPGWLPS